MAPPRPPCRVDMRRTASRAQRNDPTTLVARIRVMRAASIASTRICVSRMPALFTSAVTGPSARSQASNSRTTSASTATSACTATARPPAATMAATTASAASWRDR